MDFFQCFESETQNRRFTNFRYYYDPEQLTISDFASTNSPVIETKNMKQGWLLACV